MVVPVGRLLSITSRASAIFKVWINNTDHLHRITIRTRYYDRIKSDQG